MFAAIPYFSLPVWNIPVPGLGNVPIDPWFTLVCIGFVVGLEISRARGIKLGLDVRDVVDGAIVIVVSGFLVGHVFTVLAYHPERLETEGIMAILRFWTGFSSMGGFLGAVLGTALFYGVIRKRDAWRHADVIMYGFPFGWFFGRVGCGVVHDHIGKLTDFPLAMYFPRDHYAHGIRHELGLYEAAYTLVICAVFVVLGRRDRPPGFFLALFGLLYAPARFALDFLRADDLGAAAVDARYLGLTPGHYGSIVMFVAAAILMSRLDFKGFTPHPMDGSPPDAEPEAA